MSEADISILFDEARTALEQIDSQAYGAKKRVIKDLAEKLEQKKLRIDTIADQIVHELESRVSKTLIYNTLDEKYKSKVRAEAQRKSKKQKKEKLSQHVDSESERQILVGADGSSRAAEDEPSRVERLPDHPENYTARSLEVAAEEKSKDEQIAYLESRVKEQDTVIANKDIVIANKEYELGQLRKLLAPFKAPGKLFYKNEVFPFLSEIDPQARRIVSSELNELEARSANA